ncbi:hypothetical protein KQX54_020311 [Cotesia glomerata]|uniref:Uncharacterized protein n=1 Tax=Cotesia glomerata TaxID=32391 RepID=A0AAV7IFY4_COTGL|nr:hypothetical protein KQX54_020311 [Cotesia glomerata]
MGRCAGIERNVNVIRIRLGQSGQSGQSSCAPTLGTPAHLQRFSILPSDSPSRITNTKQLQGVGAGMRAPTLGSKSESESGSEGERLHVDVDCRIKHQHQHWSPIH